MTNSQESKNPIQVADRLFQTLELLAANGPMGLMEISLQLSLNKSTVHRILNSLIYMGYARQNPEDNRYELSFKIVGLANQMMEKVDIVKLVRPYLRRLMEDTGETVHFVERDNTDAVYIDKVESYANSVQMVSRIGSRIPLYRSGVGKAIAACLPEEEVLHLWQNSQIIAVTPYTITNYEEFRHCLHDVHTHGYALDNEENELGVRCIAAALPDHTGTARYAFSISAPVGRMDNQRILELSHFVLNTKNELMKLFF